MLLALMLMAFQSAPGVDLNAPLDTRPTLGSEMRRGYEAASECSIVLQALDYELCTGRIGQAESARIGDATAFKLGLSLAAWAALDLHVQTDEKLTDNPMARAELPQARRWAASEFVVVRYFQRKLNLTDVQVRSGAGGINDALKPRWDFWLAQPVEDLAKR
jgi:hypothetical protein